MSTMSTTATSSPPPAPQLNTGPASTGWRHSPLGHTYKKFESEWNAYGSNKSRAQQYNPGHGDGSQARVIYFIERTRQLEVALEHNNAQMLVLAKKEKRNKSDVADLRSLVNDLCSKIRTVERERDAAVKDKDKAQVEATQMGARLKTVQLDTKKYKNADVRMHTMLIQSNREASEQKLRAENLEDELTMAKEKAEAAIKEASERVGTIEKQTQESLQAANRRAEDVLEELRGIQGGWQEMKNRADASQAREDAALANTASRIAMSENIAKSAKKAAHDATRDKNIAEKETVQLRTRINALETAISNRTSEVEELRRENSRLEHSFQKQHKSMSDLEIALNLSKRRLRDESRQERVKHIKFIDRRMAEKKVTEDLKTCPPKKKPSAKKVAEKRRAEERAKERAAHKQKVLERRKKH
jgi:hypothetical protein